MGLCGAGTPWWLVCVGRSGHGNSFYIISPRWSGGGGIKRNKNKSENEGGKRKEIKLEEGERETKNRRNEKNRESRKNEKKRKREKEGNRKREKEGKQEEGERECS